MRTSRLILLLALCLPLVALARDWQLVSADSSLGFSGTVQGREFAGSFGNFEADIRFDPAQLASARFDVRVNLASVDTGSGERDDMLRSKDFFAVDKWPQARFVSEGFTRDAEGNVSASGTLTIRDISKPVVLQVQFEPGANSATLDVDTTINRLDFGLGTGDDWQSISKQINVHGHLVLQ